jgi:hypothetical protein
MKPSRCIRLITACVNNAALGLLLLCGCLSLRAEEATWIYTVQISAVVQTNPAQIAMTWLPDEYVANSYTIYRKAKEATSWGSPIASLDGSATNFTDSNVAVGSAYEYEIYKNGVGHDGYGYIYAGIQAPLTDQRGKLVLVVATNATATLSSELARLQSDLTGDGWFVIRHDVSSNDSPASVKSLITADYHSDPANVNTVFLFGRVPILESGTLNYDGHEVRAMPADAYYADMDGVWDTNVNYLPSDVELMAGRVDLCDMPGVGATVPWPNETELLRNYLNKDHNWRQALMSVPHQALMGDRRGGENGEATAGDGFRNFDPLVGHGVTTLAGVEDDSPDETRWSSILGVTNFLLAYGCGGGDRAAISFLGTNSPVDSPYAWIYSTDVVGQDAHAVFVMLFGSWFGNWDSEDNIMRSFLATPTMGLESFMAGRPHWFIHHLGLGETIGYSTRLTMNNSTLYQVQSNGMTRAIYIALMGDPTLRLDPVAPPAGLNANAVGGNVALSWSASPDTVVGYHVYRAASVAGPYTRITTSPAAGTIFTDNAVSPGTHAYMVRAVKLQTTPSGTYFNPSEGIFATVNVVPPIQLLVVRTNNGVALNWNTFAGFAYHVETKSSLNQAGWTDLSAGITAAGPATVWIDTNINSGAQRFYRIASP